MGSEPREDAEPEVEPVDIDVEAVTDEIEPEASFVEAPGLGVDLPEADTLDQRREAPLDEPDEER